MLREGAKVAIAVRREDKLKTVRAEIAAQGGDIRAYGIDLTDKHHVKAVVEAVVRDFGRLDVIINNAGIMPIRPISEVNTNE